jgi:hypothetical protein
MTGAIGSMVTAVGAIIATGAAVGAPPPKGDPNASSITTSALATFFFDLDFGSGDASTDTDTTTAACEGPAVTNFELVPCVVVVAAVEP